MLYFQSKFSPHVILTEGKDSIIWFWLNQDEPFKEQVGVVVQLRVYLCKSGGGEQFQYLS